MVSPAAALDALPDTPRMPALFVGHGTPMNAILDNAYSRAWRAVGAALPRPAAILCVSAHWMSEGETLVLDSARPRTIHDFGGFPAALYAQRYPAPGAPEAARATLALLQDRRVRADGHWGLDHGAWSVRLHLFPQADVPVFQLSLDMAMAPAGHLELARALKPLREKGVIVLGSGNLVHNLHALAPGREPYDWALAFDAFCAERIAARDAAALAAVERFGRPGRLSNPTWEHYLPALYPLGVADPDDGLTFFNESLDMAALSMRSFLFA